MVAAIMITNGGPHPPEKWAAVTVDQILGLIEIDPKSPVAAAADQAKADLREPLEAALLAEHRKVQNQERSLIDKDGDGRLDADYDVGPHIESALKAVQAATDKTIFAAHFQKPETADWLRKLLGQHFASNMAVERSWHADKNPEGAASRRFHRRLRGEPEEERAGKPAKARAR